MKSKNKTGGYMMLLLLLIGVVVMVFLMMKTDFTLLSGGKKTEQNSQENLNKQGEEGSTGIDAIDKANHAKDLIENRSRQENQALQ
jgi:hypothetical protein